MTFTSRETSLHDGQPVRLYLFELGGNQRWAYCSADRAVTLQGFTYQALAIQDDGIRMTGQASADTLRITAPRDLAPAQLFLGAPPSDEVFVTIRDYHWGEPDAEASAVVVWIGSITGVRWPQGDRSEVICDSLSSSMRRPGLRLTYQRNCPHSVYDAECGANRELHKVAATITAMDGAGITHNAAGAGAFSAGFVEWQANGRTERRGVDREAGQVLQLLGGTSGLAVGMSVSLFEGCDQTSQTCQSRFNNADNYGGFRHMPGKSPFDGDPAF